MRAKILVAALMCASVCCCSACDPEKPSDPYEALNKMLRAEYSEVVVTVTDTFGEDIFLINEFRIVCSEPVRVLYRIEQFTELGALDDELPADGAKTSVEGEAVFRDGALVSDSGGMLPGALPTGGMEFREEYFGNADLTGVYLRAEVKDGAAFLGDPSLKCTDMKVSATFLEVFYDITVTYISEIGTEVEYRYEFRL